MSLGGRQCSSATLSDRLRGFVSSRPEDGVDWAKARWLQSESVSAGLTGASRAESRHIAFVSKFSSRNSDNGLGEPIQEHFDVLRPEWIASLNGRVRTLQ